MSLSAPFRSPWPWSLATAALTAFAIGLGLWLLSHVAWAALAAALAATPTPVLLAALLATAAGFCGLASYDVIAVRHLRLAGVSNGRAALAGAVGYGITNFVGVPWLTGAMVRHVFYRDTRTGIGPLMSVVLASWVAFWATVASILGAVLILRPDIPVRAGLPPLGAWIGAALLVAVAALLVWMRDGRQLRLGRHGVGLLGRRVTLAQGGAALVDLAGSALVLRLFLPATLPIDAASFFGLFVVAVGLGVLSHVPAGIGAFEGTMLLGLQGTAPGEAATALVLYRALRTVLPFLLASLVLGLWSVAHRRARARG